MPEHEIAKHTKAIYKAWNAEHKSWKERLVEILIEIGIIVFAITLSLLLERWREDAHERKIEKKFLIGLKEDLRNDIIQLRDDDSAYYAVSNGWNYMRTSGMNNIEMNKDSTFKYMWTLANNSGFIPNNTRFEALKSSGELDVIEDDSLKSLILDLYQNRIKVLLTSTDVFTKFKSEQLLPYLSKNIRIQSNGETNISKLIRDPEMQNYLLIGGSAQEIIERYNDVINQSARIIGMIDKQYML